MVLVLPLSYIFLDYSHLSFHLIFDFLWHPVEQATSLRVAPQPPSDVKLYKAGENLRVEWKLADMYGGILLFYQLMQSNEWLLWSELEPHRTEETMREFRTPEINAIKIQGLGRDKCPGIESTVYLLSEHLQDTNKDYSWKLHSIETGSNSARLLLQGPDVTSAIFSFEVPHFPSYCLPKSPILLFCILYYFHRSRVRSMKFKIINDLTG